MTARPAKYDSADLLSLDDQVCFALHAASRAFTAVYRRVLAEFDLTYPQYLVLLVLWERDPATVKDIGRRLRLDSGTLSPLLKRLEAAGLVHRERSCGDERSLTVALSANGRALRERAQVVPQRVAAATGLAPEELAGLRSALHVLTANLDAAEQD